MPERHEFKPNKAAFVGFRFAKGMIYSFFILLILYIVQLAFLNVSVLYFILAFVLFNTYSFVQKTVAYNKTNYYFFSDKIKQTTGGIFSDREAELIVKNVTHVKMRLPWLERLFFPTGYIQIQSAGSRFPEVWMTSIDEPERMYEFIQNLMKHNGFGLTMDKLVQHEKPSTLGVFFEIFRYVIVGIIFIIYFIFPLFSGIAGNVNIGAALALVGTFGFVLVVGFLAWATIRFLDLKMRVYRIYHDTISYSEGFLTKHYSFIPMENLTDSNTKQTLIDQIFDLYDITLSCQGAGQEIKFKNMKNGPKLEQTIDVLINQAKKHKEVKKKAEKKGKKVVESKLDYETSKTMQLKMDMAKSLTVPGLFFAFWIVLVVVGGGISLFFAPALAVVGSFIILLLIGSLFGFVGAFIMVSVTTYYVNPKSMASMYDFLGSKRKEFTNEKITGVIFKESFIDKWFNTCSVNFWSIGSQEEVKFQNVKKTPDLYRIILDKVGINDDKVMYHMDSHFDFLEMIKSGLPVTVILTIGAAVLLGMAMFIHALWVSAIAGIAVLVAVFTVYNYYYYERSKMTFYKEHIYFQRGIFFKQFYNVKYDDMKGIKTMRYPFSSKGTITFNVAGEHIVQQGKNTTLMSNSFVIHYIDNVSFKDDLIDLIIQKRPSSAKVAEMEKDIRSYVEEPLMTAKPAMANTLVPLVLGSIIIFPLILLLPITLPLAIWNIAVRSYRIEPYRVVFRWGMIYKSQKSIVFSKIDHINSQQGMLNKMFNNGNVIVYTTGSSGPEMVLGMMPKYKEFYEILKKNY